MPMDRAEHLKWCKDRALEYADKGDAGGAMSSLIQDLGLHPETARSAEIVPALMMPLVVTGHMSQPGELRKFIEGFN
jgi:hypothetical protein